MRIFFAVLGLITVLAVSTGTASAVQWLENGAAITAAKAATAENEAGLPIVLEDRSVGTKVECNVKREGTVGPGVKGTITSTTYSGCKAAKGCTTIDSVTAVNLPWSTELTTVGSEVRAKLTGTSAPGFLLECVVLGVLVDDVCTRAESFFREVGNGSGSEWVWFHWSEEERLKCSLGGEEGWVHGWEWWHLVNGAALSVG